MGREGMPPGTLMLRSKRTAYPFNCFHDRYSGGCFHVHFRAILKEPIGRANPKCSNYVSSPYF